MKKSPTSTSIFDLATEIDQALEKRELELEKRILEIDERDSQLKIAKSKLDEEQTKLSTAMVAFDAFKAETDSKFLKIRSDIKLTEDLTTQAIVAKDIEAKSKKSAEELAEAKLVLKEVEKRELALSEREKNYKQNIELEVARKFLREKE